MASVFQGLQLPHNLTGPAVNPDAVYSTYVKIADEHMLPPHFIYSTINNQTVVAKACQLIHNPQDASLAIGSTDYSSTGHSSVALVGNGPMRASDRALIARASAVWRFNHLDNMLPDDRITVWVISHADIILGPGRFDKLINKLRNVETVMLLLNIDNFTDQEADWQSQAISRLLPGPELMIIHVSTTNSLSQALTTHLHLSTIRFTTGFKTINLLIQCVQSSGRLELFGFNFQTKPEILRGIHDGRVEAVFVHLALATLPTSVFLHETLCSSWRDCGNQINA
jgi:hypothetical protein